MLVDNTNRSKKYQTNFSLTGFYWLLGANFILSKN